MSKYVLARISDGVVVSELGELVPDRLVNAKVTHGDGNSEGVWVKIGWHSETYVVIPSPWQVSTLRIIERLEEAGKFNGMIAVLESKPYLLLKWRFITAGSFPSDDKSLRKFLKFVNADPDVILAPEF